MHTAHKQKILNTQTNNNMIHSLHEKHVFYIKANKQQVVKNKANQKT